MDAFLAFLIRIVVFFPGVVALLIVLAVLLQNNSKEGTTWGCVDNFKIVVDALIQMGYKVYMFHVKQLTSNQGKIKW